ncbi:MAG: hypothetical protein ACRC6X_06470 [Culicoidibacterales bacterium]
MKKSRYFLTVILVLFNLLFYLVIGNAREATDDLYVQQTLQNKESKAIAISELEPQLAAIKGPYTLTYNTNSLIDRKNSITFSNEENVRTLCDLTVCDFIPQNINIKEGAIIGQITYKELEKDEKAHKVVYLPDGREIPILAIIGSKVQKSFFDEGIILSNNLIQKQTLVSGAIRIFYPKSETDTLYDSLLAGNSSIKIDANKNNQKQKPENDVVVDQFSVNFWTWMVLILCLFICISLNLWEQEKRTIAIKSFIGAKKRHIMVEFFTKMLKIAIFSWIIALAIQQMNIFFPSGMFLAIPYYYYPMPLIFNIIISAITTFYILIQRNFIDLGKILTT